MARTILFLIVLGIAAGTPFVVHHAIEFVDQHSDSGDPRQLLTQFIRGNTPPTSDSPPADIPLPELDGEPGRKVGDSGATGPPGLTVADLLRFDITKIWLQMHWRHVTTDIPAYPLHACRVPIMTGTEPYDVAGSITYYFNEHHRCERIQLHGFTADYRQVANLVQQRFWLKQYQTIGPVTYLAFHGEYPIGIMQVKVEPSYQDELGPVTRFEIELELNFPQDGAVLSKDKLQELFELQRANMI